MRRLLSILALALLGGVGLMSSCDNNDSPTPNQVSRHLATQLERVPFYTQNPEQRAADVRVVSEAHRLEFFGWGEQSDKRFTLSLPESGEAFERVILEYRMGTWGERPGEWDYTTMLFVEDKATGEWYEIARAITPYGNSFGSSWSKIFYLDVTEYLPMLQGETTFRLYYGGWDATATRAHTATFTFNYYAGSPTRSVCFHHKLYDSSRDGNSGYRGWAYGVAGHDIEDAARLGERTVEVPAQVEELEMRVAITGHGHDQGSFLDRPGYRTKNAAEFDENFYTIRINGVEQSAEGHIFYSNANNYPQAGTYLYDRANWAPGNPINLHFWQLDRPAEQGYGTLRIDLDLEPFRSAMSEPNAEGVAQYIVEVDLFGYKR